MCLHSTVPRKTTLALSTSHCHVPHCLIPPLSRSSSPPDCRISVITLDITQLPHFHAVLILSHCMTSHYHTSSPSHYHTSSSSHYHLFPPPQLGIHHPGPDSMMEVQVLIPQPFMGTIIGTGGAKIKELRAVRESNLMCSASFLHPFPL